MEKEIIIRLVVSGILGALIGLEREIRYKEAGLRTHFVVAVGSALVMVVSKYGFVDVLHPYTVVLDPSRIAAQVVSGIGFLGAGTILVQRQSVRGLTTAAGLWATSGIGLAIGAGMYTAGVGSTVLVLIALEILDKSQMLITRHKSRVVIRTDNVNAVLGAIRASGFKMQKIKIDHSRVTDVDNADITITTYLSAKSAKDRDRMIDVLGTMPHVKSVKIE
ncbi:MgtC/SapB family protein [Alicyclobacillus kakegawensis]|uniref:MgtC/SapB family protein n=1 Tax=Alicyclobacillus kakegawensis TaxID=392012 RepID=UPI00082DEA1E